MGFKCCGVRCWACFKCVLACVSCPFIFCWTRCFKCVFTCIIGCLKNAPEMQRMKQYEKQNSQYSQEKTPDLEAFEKEIASLKEQLADAQLVKASLRKQLEEAQ